MENVVYDDAGDLCASGECTIVLFDFEASKSIKISEEIRELIENYN
jgi:acyl-CoA thioesterase FadM